MEVSWKDTDAVPTASAEGVTRTLRVRVRPADEASVGTAEVRFVAADGRTIGRLPVSWRTGPPVVVSPRAFFQSGVRPGTAVTLHFLVRATDGADRRPTAAELDGQPIEVSCMPVHEDDEGTVAWRGSVVVGVESQSGVSRRRLRLILGESAPEEVIVPVTLLVAAEGTPEC